MSKSPLISSAKWIARLAALCLFVVAASANAFAGPVGVTYTVSGASGAWVLNFSVTNNLNAGQGIYLFGIVLPDQDIVSNPSSAWVNHGGTGNTTENLSSSGGPNVTFNNLWRNPFQTAPILFGGTLSGFEAEADTVTMPLSVEWFACGADITPNGTAPYLGGGSVDNPPNPENPCFVGTATLPGSSTPEPSSLLLLGTGLFGLGPFLRRRFARA